MGSRSKKKKMLRDQYLAKNTSVLNTSEGSCEYNFVIGIISYLPDDLELKKVRVARLNALFKQCDILLNLPIMIIAQNWEGISLQEGTIKQPITIYKYPKLGITGARRELRKRFLESSYDYLIMLDDDSQLAGDVKDAREYLRQIKAHPNMYCEYKPQLLKLFAISKCMYSLIDFPEGGADDPNPNKRFFEDMTLIKGLDKFYKNRKFYIPFRSLMEISDAAFDKYSSGWHEEVYDSEGKWTRHHTGDISRALVKNAKLNSNGTIRWVWPTYVKPNTDWDNY